MGIVALTFNIMPESTEIDLDNLKHEIEKVILKHKNIELRSLEEKPVAFGLKSLELLITMPDKMHGTDTLEEALSAIPGVASVEAGDVTLV